MSKYYPSLFCPYALTDWLELCEGLIPHVPAEQIATLERDDVLKFDQAGPHQGRLAAAWVSIGNAAQAAEKAGDVMLRFDPCASVDLKVHMDRAATGEWSEAAVTLTLADPRALEIFEESPLPDIPVWRRPWISAEIVDGYPVEYRAFVMNGQVQGVSSYYPQRPLPDAPRHLDQAGVVTTRTNTLIDALSERTFLWPLRYRIRRPAALRDEREIEDPGIAFTADFIVRDDGAVLFLEGGPPAGRGAHPCCFLGADGEVLPIEGVRLAPVQGAYPDRPRH